MQQLEQSTAEGIANELEDDESMIDENGDDADAGPQEDEGDDEDDSGDSEGSDAESDASNDASDEEDDPLAPVDPAFRRRVAEALQVAGMLDDGTTRPNGKSSSSEDDSEDDDDDGSSSEEELWDDDQMLKVDEQLAEVFRQRAGTARKGNLKSVFSSITPFLLALILSRPAYRITTLQTPHPRLFRCLCSETTIQSASTPYHPPPSPGRAQFVYNRSGSKQ